jgi:hypothetical protein
MRCFWRIESFPYCLSGTQVKQFDGGYVTTLEYGSGNLMSPFLVLDDIEGCDLQHKIDMLSHERDSELQSLELKYKIKLAELIPIPPYYTGKV